MLDAPKHGPVQNDLRPFVFWRCAKGRRSTEHRHTAHGVVCKPTRHWPVLERLRLPHAAALHSVETQASAQKQWVLEAVAWARQGVFERLAVERQRVHAKRYVSNRPIHHIRRTP